MRRPVTFLLAAACVLQAERGRRAGVDRRSDWNRQRRTGRSSPGCRRSSELPGADGRHGNADHERQGAAALPGATSWTVRTGDRGPGVLRLTTKQTSASASAPPSRERRFSISRSSSRPSWRALARASRREGVDSRRASARRISRRSLCVVSACSTSSGRPLAYRPRRPEASPPIACPRSAPAPTRTRFSSTAQTLPAPAAARRDPSRASTSFRKCRFSGSGRRPSSATCRERSSMSSPGRAATVFCMTRPYYGQAAALTSQPVDLPYPGPGRPTSALRARAVP